MYIHGIYSSSYYEYWRVKNRFESFLWDRDWKIIPAFTDNMSRMVWAKIEIDMPHWGFNCQNAESYIMRQGLDIGVGSSTIPSELVKRMLPGITLKNKGWRRSFLIPVYDDESFYHDEYDDDDDDIALDQNILKKEIETRLIQVNRIK